MGWVRLGSINSPGSGLDWVESVIWSVLDWVWVDENHEMDPGTTLLLHETDRQTDKVRTMALCNSPE